jgi:hypothetical protein
MRAHLHTGAVSSAFAFDDCSRLRNGARFHDASAYRRGDVLEDRSFFARSIRPTIFVNDC